MKQFRTNERLWLIFSVCLFVAFGFVDITGGMSKGPVGLWYTISDFHTHMSWKDHSRAEIILPIFALAVMCAIPAILFGWVLQALVGVVRDRRTQSGYSSPLSCPRAVG